MRSWPRAAASEIRRARPRLASVLALPGRNGAAGATRAGPTRPGPTRLGPAFGPVRSLLAPQQEPVMSSLSGCINGQRPSGGGSGSREGGWRRGGAA